MKHIRRLLSVTLSSALMLSAVPAAVLAQEAEPVSLDFAALLADGTYKVEKAAQEYITADCYEIAGVVYETNITNPEYQYMNIWIPAAYVNEDGSFNHEAEVEGYTVDTAPIVFRNNCAGWFSSSADNESENVCSFNASIESGFIYIACGARSRNANNGAAGFDHVSYGKAPAPIVDLKAGIRYLRLNDEAMPGDTDHIFSIGGSGAGEMSTLVGATGNMSEYYPYLYKAGAAGIEYDEETGEVRTGQAAIPAAGAEECRALGRKLAGDLRRRSM